jgi:hypothetical protein
MPEVDPTPSSVCPRKPPTTAPTMPMSAVTMNPPGSRPA